MLSDSRKRKLAMLAQSLAKKDIATASQVLRSLGHSGANLHGPKADCASPDPEQSQQPGDAPAPSPAEPQDPSDIVDQPDAKRLQPLVREPMELRQACPGVELVPASGHKCWMVRKTLGEVDAAILPAAREYAAVMRGARQRFDELEASPGLCHVANARPEDLLFMDVESCGLMSCGVFLVGMMRYEDEQLVFEQALARDYAEEAAILHAMAARLEETGVLVTFSGKTFDINMIKDRSDFHGVDLGVRLPPHLDLLQESRRRFKGRLPNCKLQTLETHLCHRRRIGDIPEGAIPDAYHRFVNTGDARQVADILRHNLLDLLTMAQVLTVLLTGCEPELPQRRRRGQA